MPQVVAAYKAARELFIKDVAATIGADVLVLDVKSAPGGVALAGMQVIGADRGRLH